MVYQKYKDDLLSIAHSLLNDYNAAEDAVHDVFVRFAQSIDNYRYNGNLKGYLATCMCNQIRDRFRANKRQPVELEENTPVSAEVDPPYEHAMIIEESQRLRKALGVLPYLQREVITLHLHGEMTFKQIAQLQDASINTIQGRYRYGLDKLRTILK